MLEIKIYFPPIEMLRFKKPKQNYNKSQKITSTLPHCRSDLSILINIAATELP